MGIFDFIFRRSKSNKPPDLPSPTPLLVTVQIIGWHPRWKKIASIKAIRAATDLGIAEAKTIVDKALTDGSSYFDVTGLEKANLVAKNLADLGAIVSCVGRVYDSYPGEEGEIPYRKQAIGTMLVKEVRGNQFTAELIRGEAHSHFEISIPINSSLDIRALATLSERCGQDITFHLVLENLEERQFWEDFAYEGEIDIHRLSCENAPS